MAKNLEFSYLDADIPDLKNMALRKVGTLKVPIITFLQHHIGRGSVEFGCDALRIMSFAANEFPEIRWQLPIDMPRDACETLLFHMLRSDLQLIQDGQYTEQIVLQNKKVDEVDSLDACAVSAIEVVRTKIADFVETLHLPVCAERWPADIFVQLVAVDSICHNSNDRMLEWVVGQLQMQARNAKIEIIGNLPRAAKEFRDKLRAGNACLSNGSRDHARVQLLH
jgi:hypothetical protein